MSVERATSFGAATGSYDVGRPEYPQDAVDWLLDGLPEGARHVADVGAGTGKLTRALLATGADVIAVDPDSEMLAALRRNLPDVPTSVGTAERLPLDDASVDAVVLGQAWHWVEPIAASAEIGRVVRPGGTLGAIWNVRDDRVDWVQRLTAIMHGSPAEQMVAYGGPRFAEPFGEMQTRRWEWSREMTREQLHEMARSRSAVITASAEEKERIEREMDALFDDLGLAPGRTIAMPYVTAAFRATRD
ncbi:SAM-dependent methyltransferase [Microbacterium resistens]|uniref:SAM-dependent methyltransferase n=1 Tax=Microbacterium resistens TaxID=156977 RepID=A0ABU1S7K5_9MICO|nr:class I SAM-dependent methyltransferase [Microbacterium resistens]MDR6865594.1 SAM-dependent methyltransferase [Microbacterium resistens]